MAGALPTSTQRQQHGPTAAAEEEEEEDRRRKAALRCALVTFYEKHNPAQLADALLDEVCMG
jgi:hypothetical protein